VHRRHDIRFLALDRCSVKVPDPLKALRSTLAVALVALLVPALASAETYVVNVTGNVAPDVGCTDPQDDCDLWEAIDISNSTPGVVDTIEFAVGEVAVTSALPAISEPAIVDGTAPGGKPGVEIFWDAEGFVPGLDVEGDGTTIEGVAIFGFLEGVFLGGANNRICNSYLGTNLSGELEGESTIGVGVGGEGADNEVGAGCAKGNLISGNEWFGVIDEGIRTHIAGNLIGTDLSGDLPLPNGPMPSTVAGGVWANGTDLLVGGAGPGEGNTIAYNEGSSFAGGGGVVVEDLSTTIRRNSIFANVDRGIFFSGLISGPIPELQSAASSEATGTTVVSGAFEAGPGEDFAIDLFANGICDEYESGFEEFTAAGQGETYLGSVTVKTDGTGAGKFEATVPVQAEGVVLTATATAVASGSTSEFSGCLVAPKPTPKPGPPSPPPADQPVVNAPVPENGESVVVAPKAGKVFVTLPGEKKPILLQDGQQIPVGSIVDATRGKVTLTSINKAGETQTAVFFGGKFLVVQQEGSGLVVLKLRGGNFRNCAKASGSGATASAGRSGRRLWGSGKGKFRTEGNYGSATVRGTVWLTEDRCAGTFFKVRKGVVTVRDFAANETFPLGKGKSYFAQP
jgi:hypothetical protein